MYAKSHEHISLPLRSNLTILFGGIAALIVAIIISTLVTLVYLHQQAKTQAEVTTQIFSRSIEQTLQGLIETIDTALFASSKVIGQEIAAGKVDGQSIVNTLIDHRSQVFSAAYFGATDEHGNIIYGPDIPSPPINISDRDYFIKLRDDRQAGLVVNKPILGRTNQKWVWIFARPINKPDGSFGGVTFAAIDVDEIDKIFAKIKMESGRFIALRSADLGLITRYPTSSLNYFPIGERRLSIAFLETLKANALEGTYNTGADSVDGIDSIHSYQRNEKYGYIINVGIDKESAFAEWRKHVWKVCARAVVFILVLLILSFLIKRAWRRQEEVTVTLQEAQQIARLGQYTYDLRTGRWTSSAILDDIVGIDSNYPHDEQHWSDLAAPELRQMMLDHRRAIIEQRAPFDLEYRIIRPSDGQECWVHSKGKLQFDDGVPVALVGAIHDITERKQTEANLRIAASAFESQESMFITDANSVFLQVNRAFTESTGYTSEDVVGRTPRILRSDRHDADFFRAMWASIKSTGKWSGEIWDRRKGGEEYQKWLTISAVKDDKGIVTHYIGAQYDISERKKAEEKINELAFFDQLTGLPNRTLLLDRLKQAMTASSRSGNYGAVLLIDLDNFKTLNDTLGHDMGDLLLKQVAQRLIGCVRGGDTVARLGGDEFVVMLVNLSISESEAATQTELIGEKIRAELNHIYLLKDVAFHNTPSIGASLFRSQLTEIDALLKQADLAMYKSKDAGRNTLRFFDPDMEVVVMKRAALETDLRQAVEGEQFVLHYQPQMASGKVIGVEALVRWQHPQRGMVSPAEFIPLAEETGLILPLGKWVLETACMQLAEWAGRPEMKHLTIAVNVSAHQFRQADFVDQVLTVIKNTGANSQRLKLELTESMLVSNIEEIIEKMFALKGSGVSFSLDDFGTGYSSLTYLKRLPLDQLKIDQSFVRDILIDPNDAAIAKTIIALAQSLGLGVIAEGVETALQRDFLANSGCHAYQGYFFSRPLPIEGFEQFAQHVRLAS